MEVLAQTEYQDLYRITDGVLLVVNKFIPINYVEDKYITVYRGEVKRGKYNKGCQDWLQVLKEDYHDKYHNITISKGTVIYIDRPVVSTDNKSDWNYEIKTTGSCFGGNFDEITNYLNCISEIIKKQQK